MDVGVNEVIWFGLVLGARYHKRSLPVLWIRMVFFLSRAYIPHFLHGTFRYTYTPFTLSEE
jgi:hypothetical protein